ncbi:MAG: cytochrome c-type biogenesis protein CcmH [Dehalococcoidia bacterium]
MIRRLPALLAVLAAASMGFAALTSPAVASAQTPSPTPTPPAAAPTPTEEQMIAVEHQLLCPLCVNERLDVCTIAVCMDMKDLIRERLAAGETPEQIVAFFEARYGQRIRADLPRRGFNLVLFGWVGGAILATGAAAAYVLYAMRRDSRLRRARAASPPMDDAWVDRLLEDTADGAPRDDAPGGAR